uniref:Uncharacterized protein n=1 Tax=Zea mays TaxID=4577 RepID=C0PN07_MAIZE|nr:unknown [Zea mays]
MAAKVFLLLRLSMVAVVLAAIATVALAEEADPRALPAQWTTAKKYKATMDAKTRQAFDGVVAAATAEKRSQAVEAVLQQQLNMDVSLSKATSSGDENNYVSVAAAYEKAAVAPDPGRCPAVDKPFCETYAKTEKAFSGTIASGDTPKSKLGITDAVLKLRLATDANINKAYAEGDKDKIAKILAAYGQAADAVAAAPPPEKLKVMEKTFSAVAAAAHQEAAAAAAAAAVIKV